MAATWLKPLHANKGKTIAQTITDRTDYAENPDKTDGGKLVTGYGCDPRTSDEEFYLSKRDYEYITGRNQGKDVIIAAKNKRIIILCDTAAKLRIEVNTLTRQLTPMLHRLIMILIPTFVNRSKTILPSTFFRAAISSD